MVDKDVVTSVSATNEPLWGSLIRRKLPVLEPRMSPQERNRRRTKLENLAENGLIFLGVLSVVFACVLRLKGAI